MTAPLPELSTSTLKAMTDRKPLFVRCGHCDEHWKLCTLPIDVSDIPSACCPNCGARHDIFLCATEGTGAVKQPRQGRLTHITRSGRNARPANQEEPANARTDTQEG